jgi:hypothetical protein
MERRYDFEGSVYVDEDFLEEIAESFLRDEGKNKEWTDLNDYIWDFYSDYDNWDQVLDEITSDVFKIYEKLVGEENEEE